MEGPLGPEQTGTPEMESWKKGGSALRFKLGQERSDFLRHGGIAADQFFEGLLRPGLLSQFHVRETGIEKRILFRSRSGIVGHEVFQPRSEERRVGKECRS